MAKIKIGNTVLNRGAKGDKGDPGQDGLNRPDIRPVKTIQELLAPLTGLEKELNIQADIVLTENVTLPPNAIISNGGGKIVFGNNTITFVNNTFYSNSNSTFIEIGANGVIDNNSTFQKNDLIINWFDITQDGDKLASTGTDNRNQLLQIQKIWNYQQTNVYLKGEGIVAMSVTASTQNQSQLPNNLYLSKGSRLYMDEGTGIMQLPTNLLRTYLFVVWFSDYSKIMGGELIGDLPNRIWTNEADLNEPQWNFGIVLHGGSSYFESNTKLSNWSSDGFIAESYHQAYYNGQIVENLFLNYKNSDLTEQGVIVTNAINGNTVKSVSDLISITNHLSEGHLLLNGGSFGGPSGMSSWNYWIAWYDETAESIPSAVGFIGKSKLLQMHDEIKIPEGATQIRLIIYNPLNWVNLQASLWSSNLSKYIDLHFSEVEWCKRQGISNPSTYTKIHDTHFHDIGRSYPNDTYPFGVFGTPGFIIDIEDAYEKNAYIDIYNNVFDGGRSSIITKGARYINIFNNVFRTSAKISNFGLSNAVNLRRGYYNNFNNNQLFDSSISIGRGSSVKNNKIFNSNIDVQLEETVVENNKIVNGSLGILSPETPVWDLTVAYIKYNLFEFDLPSLSGVSAFSTNEFGHLVLKNNIIDFGNNAYNTNILPNGGTIGVSRGYVDNLLIKGLSVGVSHQYCSFPIMNIKRMVAKNLPFNFRGASESNYLIEDSEFAKIRFTLNNYPNTNLGSFTTITVKNTDLVANGDLLNLGGASFMIDTFQKDVNFIFEGGVSKQDWNSSNSRHILLAHNGETTFKNRLFTSLIASSQDLSSFTCGAITFIDCEFVNTSFILRAQDKLLYTKLNPNAPSYADNATALAALGEGYYYKLPDNTFAITHL